MKPLTELTAYGLLRAHRAGIAPVHLRDLFARDPRRFEAFQLRLDDLLIDYSKHRITAETLDLLVRLAEEADLPAWIERMFRGEHINATENRAVLHIALRNRSEQPVLVDGHDVMPEVKGVLARMRAFTERVRGGSWRGHTGREITDIVNLGIGGSRWPRTARSRH